MKVALPVDAVLGAVLERLDCSGGDAAGEGAVVLGAPPGCGKTTRVPAALLQAVAGEVLVLEPRRIAARAAARRVAHELGVKLGGLVGYEVRDDLKVSAQTRLRFMTEGVLVQRLVRDPFLEGVGAVVLDEFHERHVETDLALAMLREVRQTVREDLRLVVMSATLDAGPVVDFLAPCAVLEASGRSFPVEIEHCGPPSSGPAGRAHRGDALAEAVRDACLRALEETTGDVLAFLPGMGEILRARQALERAGARLGFLALPLHGSMSATEQDRAIRRLPERKVVLSTNVAESSLTIEGVTAVVDAGLARVLRHDPARGLDVLRLERISRASATQRAGRAGRLSPGRCYRLWSLGEERGMAEFETPEIRRVDLAAPILMVRAFASARDPRDFGWFDRPNEGAFERADRLLAELGLVDVSARSGGALTELGARAARVPAHPRIARMLLEARRRGCEFAAAEVAALLTERELRRDARHVDLDVEIEALRRFAERGPSSASGLDEGALRAVLRARDRFVPRGRRSPERSDPAALGCALIAGFPDRVVRHDGDGHGQLATGQGVTIADPSLQDVPLLVALRVGGDAGRQGPRAKIALAAAIERDWLEVACPGSVTVERGARFGEDGQQVIAVTRTKFFGLVLEEKRGGAAADPAAVEALLADAVRHDPWRFLGEQRAVRRFLARVDWLRGIEGLDPADPLALPELGDADVGNSAAALAPGKRTLRAFRDAPVLDVLEQRLTRAQRARLQREAPDRIALRNGRELRVEYDDTSREPHVASRLQDFFGTTVTPRIGGGRVPLTLHLLAPNRRAVQVTSDLESFWATVYPRVRSELRNRYPKHAWPDDPIAAAPDRPGRRRRRS